LSCHKFNEASRVDGIVQRIQGGAAIALVTDSGMPAVSDPGSRMVAACRRAGVAVTAIPGPTAVTTAVALSGFRGSGFVFAGFAPRKSGALRRLLGELGECPVPVVLYESPYRMIKLLGEIEGVLGDRPVFVGRELTKKFEETRVGTPAELMAAYAGRTVKGEIVVVIAPRVDRHEDG
jgi:16S rRNA (cytidine1402-2'-O)-methyltransferase